MYTIEDLFDKRYVIGTKLEQILEERSYTKAELCKRAGISRPTLDKMLAGTLTSKTNYEKHNLDRARNQIALVADIETKLDYMDNYIMKTYQKYKNKGKTRTLHK